VLRRSAPKQPKLTPADRMFWVWLRRVWGHWKSALLIVKPAAVIASHRQAPILGLYSLLWAAPEWCFHRLAGYGEKADGGEAASNKSGASSDA